MGCRYNWWEEATHGVGAHGHETTNVAFPITTAMSFNRSLWKATGALIGTEARALMNLGKGGSDFWAPVVNLARDGTVGLLPPSVHNTTCSRTVLHWS